MNPLLERIETLQQSTGRARARDLAAALGVTEMEIVAARGGVALRPRWTEPLAALPSLGRVMALTRNETAVHERRGTYAPAEGEGPVRLVLGPDIDLRLFLARWCTAWAVVENERRSVQIFDAHGEAVHKVYVSEPDGVPEWASLRDALRADEEPPAPTARPTPKPAIADDAVDVEGLHAAWRAMTDTHEFVMLLRNFNVTRTQALRLAPPEMVCALPPCTLAAALERAAAAELPIMIFVGNPGCIQIHTGPVRRLVPTPGSLNVLDPDFNLHVRLDRLAACCRVRKPTADGIVTSLEVFDVDGTLAVQLFGARKPGQPQPPAWEALVDGLGSAC